MRQEGLNLTIIEAIQDQNLLGASFKDLSTWRAWFSFLKAIYCLPMEPEELEIFRAATGLERPPAEPPKEIFVIAGRRSGKSFIASLIAVFESCFKDWSSILSPGEVGFYAITAADRKQAKIIMNYVRGFLENSPVLQKMVKEYYKEEIELQNRINIDIKTCNFRSIRGYTLVGSVFEEVAFWRSEEFSANPDKEVYRATLPGLSTTGGRLLAISTPYSKAGLLFEKFQSHYGKEGDVLIWRAPTQIMNPTIGQELIARALEEDPEGAKSEWLSEFRQDIESFISLETLQACVVPGRQFLPPDPSKSYIGFIDPSGGSNDSFTLAIAHFENEKVIVDQILERRPPFSPESVVKEFAAVLKEYRIYSVMSDRYAGQWVVESFIKAGISVNYSELSASELYQEVLPLLNAGKVELPDNQRLLNQFASLERRVRAGGKDLITHPPGGHDDLANSVSGSVYYSNKTGRHFFRIWSPIDDMPTETALSFMSGKK
jgi:hypothetical protein